MIPSWLNSSKESDAGVVFRDVVFTMMLMFTVLFLAAIIHINPKAKDKTQDIQTPGSVMVDISWPDGEDADVDLWTKAPLDKRPVGYSNRAGVQFNLLRDDLGMRGDSTPLNYENAYTRGLADGEYIVNVMLYDQGTAPLPIPVTVVVRLQPCQGCGILTINTSHVLLHGDGDQVTVIRFRLKHGELVPGSMNRIPIKLREYQPAGGEQSYQYQQYQQGQQGQ